MMLSWMLLEVNEGSYLISCVLLLTWAGVPSSLASCGCGLTLYVCPRIWSLRLCISSPIRQALNRLQPMFGEKVSVALGHGIRCMPKDIANGAHRDTGHYHVAGRSM